ncbi:hypothetical protein [Humibacillus xanthopallidus]|uniref:hypothetical protein n=1 Tax=Humibacillus xanthopallidus TaxID=412689 RepID=UPI00163A0CC4|nr:hypothetical protein [Humibacillus xanthopallidus]
MLAVQRVGEGVRDVGAGELLESRHPVARLDGALQRLSRKRSASRSGAFGEVAQVPVQGDLHAVGPNIKDVHQLCLGRVEIRFDLGPHRADVGAAMRQQLSG